MLDRVDFNVQALGALAHAVSDTPRHMSYASGHGPEPPRLVPDAGPAFVNAVAEHTHGFGQAMPQVPFEIANDEKTSERAWWHPYFGGNLDIARETAGLASYERQVQPNAKALRAVEQMAGTILDTFA